MNKPTSILAIAVQIVACASMLPKSASLSVETRTVPRMSLSERAAKIRQILSQNLSGVADDKGIKLAQWWNNWGNWPNWGNWNNWNNWLNWSKW